MQASVCHEKEVSFFVPGCKIPEKTGSKGHSSPPKSASESDDHGRKGI